VFCYSSYKSSTLIGITFTQNLNKGSYPGYFKTIIQSKTKASVKRICSFKFLAVIFIKVIFKWRLYSSQGHI